MATTETARRAQGGTVGRNKPKMTARERRRMIEDLILLAPNLILTLGLVVVPFLVGLPMLFTDRTGFMDPEVRYVGFENFIKPWQDPDLRAEYLPALQRTLRFTALNYLMVYVFGLTLALFMYELGFKTGFFSVIYLPRLISGLAVGYMVIMLFAQSTGSLNLLFLDLGWLQKPINIATDAGTTYTLPLVVGWKAAGYNMAIFMSGLYSIPRDTIEAATVDGASYLQRLIHVYFPQMIPSFLIATISCLLGSFGLLDLLLAMGANVGNKAAKFVSVVLLRYSFSQGRMALGMTLSLMTLLPLALIAVFLQRLQKRLSYEV